MSFLDFFLGQKKATAGVAKERLQIILAHERSGRNAGTPDYLPALQRELMVVISKYIKVSNEDVKVVVEHKDNLDVLEVKVELQHPAQAAAALAGTERRGPFQAMDAAPARKASPGKHQGRKHR